MLRIDFECFIKDRYWFGWVWDRQCLMSHHRFYHTCQTCNAGLWYYISPKQVGFHRFGGKVDVTNMYYETND